MDVTLVDSSMWVAFFRGDAEAVRRLDPLLAQKQAVINGPIFVEVVSGATNRALQATIVEYFRAIPWLRPFEPAWERAAETRYTLARRGRTSSVLDVMIALSASDWGATLLTRDRDFVRIAEVLPLDLELF